MKSLPFLELPKKSFKLRIKNKLLSVLEDEDSFIEVCRFAASSTSKKTTNQESNKETKKYIIC